MRALFAGIGGFRGELGRRPREIDGRATREHPRLDILGTVGGACPGQGPGCRSCE